MAELHSERRRRRALGHTVIVALTVAFYVAIVPVAVLFSGPIYQAVRCTFGECVDPGERVEFALPSRGALRIGSAIRLPNGEPIGRVVGFATSGDERFTRVIGRVDPASGHVLDGSIRCEATANFNLNMDADLVVSACPGLDLPPQGAEEPLVCGAVDHFERMGQELRRFVLENVRPGDYPAPMRLAGPCGSDNEAATRALRAVLGQ